jgi:UDP-N-acetylmuramate dehydrogenase
VEVGAAVPLERARDAVLKLRRGKGMVLDPEDPDTRSVGTFFVNPILSAAAYQAIVDGWDGPPPAAWPGSDGLVKVSAAWLIENAGFRKGYARAGAAISGKHTLALTNRGGTTEDLLALAREVRDGVHERFGVTLRPEPVLINCAL